MHVDRNETAVVFIDPQNEDAALTFPAVRVVLSLRATWDRDAG
jgi:hypothetical protein